MNNDIVRWTSFKTIDLQKAKKASAVSSGAALSFVFSGMGVELKAENKKLSDNVSTSVVADNVLDADASLLGYKYVLAYGIFKSAGSRVVIQGDVAGDAFTLIFPFGDEIGLEGNHSIGKRDSFALVFRPGRKRGEKA